MPRGSRAPVEFESRSGDKVVTCPLRAAVPSWSAAASPASSAARALAATGRDVVVLEGSPRIGGKLRTESVGGVAVDVGAEAMLARRPEGTDLVRELGLDLVHPATTTSAIWTRDALRTLPRSVMGVPADAVEVERAGLLTDAGLDRLRHEEPVPALADGEDVSVGDLVAARLGSEVVDRLVEPLLGGVYAGHARLLSARATVPQLAAWSGRSLVDSAADALAASTRRARVRRDPGRAGPAPRGPGGRAGGAHRRDRPGAAAYSRRLRPRRGPDHGRRGGRGGRGRAGDAGRADGPPARRRRPGRGGRAGRRGVRVDGRS